MIEVLKYYKDKDDYVFFERGVFKTDSIEDIEENKTLPFRYSSDLPLDRTGLIEITQAEYLERQERWEQRKRQHDKRIIESREVKKQVAISELRALNLTDDTISLILNLADGELNG